MYLAISGEGAVNAIIVLLVIGAIIGILIWLIGISPLPPPFKNVLTWICYGAAALVLINFLLSLIGKPFITF